jgi:arsenical pump membrane protein
VAEPLALALALIALAAALAAAVTRPPWAPEAAVAVVGAGVLIAVGAISPARARHAAAALGPTVGFLAALLVLADGCRRAGLFDALGALLARGARGQPTRLLALVFVAAAAVTAILGLDATVVLLTPVVYATTVRLRTSPRPHTYACTHLANSGSLLLVVSNLTNLLAFHASRLSFTRFAALMALPWLSALAVEWAVLRRFFAVELGRPHPPAPARPVVAAGETPPAGREDTAPAVAAYPLAVLALTLAGFVASSPLRVAPVWFAAAGAVAVSLPWLAGRPGRPRALALELLRAAEPGFLLFVLGLGVIVASASVNGLHSAVSSLLPAGRSLPDLLAIAALSAVLANLLNNLPATLILLSVTPGLGPAAVLAMLVGVNVGPNLTYSGSLATLLWRRVLQARETSVDLREFTVLGLLTVPATLLTATILVWFAAHHWG